MTQILRRQLTRSPNGQVFTHDTERLTDDGRGHVHHTTHRTAVRCTGCGALASGTEHLRGRCDYCRTRGTCTHCLASCQVCSRRLCGACRRGFAGPPPMTVCQICLAKLIRRQAFEDQWRLRQAAVQHQMLQQRERARLDAMRLQAARMQTMAHLHAARMRLTAQLQAARMRQANQMAMAREATREKVTVQA